MNMFFFPLTHTRLVAMLFCKYFIRQDRKQDQWEFIVQAQLEEGFRRRIHTQTHTHTPKLTPCRIAAVAESKGIGGQIESLIT